MNPTQILSAGQIRQKVRRIASQLYETNFDEAALVLAGVAGEGYELARRLAIELRQIAPFEVTLVLAVPVRKIQVAVLVNRNHTRYPIAADFIGLELVTTLNEHVEVVLSDPAREGVYLR